MVMRVFWLCLALLFPFSLFAQTPFVCDGDFFLSLGSGGNTGFYRVTIDPVFGVVFNGFSPGNSSGTTVNAMGYRVTDNFIYGVHPNTHDMYRIGSDGVAFLVTNLNLLSGNRYVAGDVTPDGNYLVLMGDDGGGSDHLALVDLTNSSYPVSIVNMSSSSGGLLSIFCADITFDPLTGILYGYDAQADRLITVNHNNGQVDQTTFAGGQLPDLLGAMYFDAFGELHAYGRPNGGSTQNTFFDINKNTGAFSIVTTGPSASQNDGCSCPYTIEINNWVSPYEAAPCDTVFYFIEIANNSGGDKTGLTLYEPLPPGLTILSIVDNPFGGNIQSGPGTNVLWLTNVTTQVGIDTLVMSVTVDMLQSGPFSSQAVLSGLPAALGDSVLSDDPFTVPDNDPTTLIVTPDTVIMPGHVEYFCQGEDITLDASGLGAIVYQWSDGSTNATLNVNQPGTYWVVGTECDVMIDTFVVHEWPLPVVQASGGIDICQGESAMLSAAGALSYTWYEQGNSTPFSQGTNPTVSPTDTTWYYLLGTDANGCENWDSVRVNVWPLPLINPGPDTAICPYEDLMLGSLSNPTGTYSWNPANELSSDNTPTTVFSPPGPGIYSYTLTGTDLNGCTDSADVEIEVHVFNMSFSQINVDCYGNENGQATMTMMGIGPYVWQYLDSNQNVIANGSQGNVFLSVDSLAPGDYTGLVVDGHGCKDTVDFTITEPVAPVSVSVSNLVNVDCFGNTSGELTAIGAGGTPSYEYSIDGGFNYQTSPVFPGLGATIYTITIRDANGCLSSISDTIRSPTGLFGDLQTKKNVTCFGQMDGALTLVGSGGTGPYSLTLDGVNYVNGLNFTGLGPGQDTIMLVDANGCIVSIPFEIFEPPLLTGMSVWERDIDCFGNAIGEIQLSSGGGSRPHLYSLDGINFQADSMFWNVPAGMYNLIVQDDSLCQTIVPVTLTEPPLLDPQNIYQENVDCFGNATGDVIIEAIGGTMPYQYSIDSLNFQSTGDYPNLTAGSYTITVVDDSNCVSQIVVDITEPDSLILAVDVQANVACFGDSTAYIQLMATGGSLPYNFSIDGSNYGADSLFANLPSGNYQFWIRDDSSCLDQINVEISEPPLLELPISELRQVDCFGNANGLIAVGGIGGVPPYEYSLNGAPAQNSGIFSPLAPGLYNIVVEDDSSCTTRLDFEITEPPLLEISTAHSDVSCYNFSDGTAEVMILGGTAPYDILWDSNPSQSTAQATALPGGHYQVIVTDQNGCMEMEVLEIYEPDTLVIGVIPSSIIEAYCDWANGAGAVMTGGGRQPHMVQWLGPNQFQGFSSDTLRGGLYQITVTDSMGCQSTIEFDMPETPPAEPFFITDPTYEDSILLSRAGDIFFQNETVGGVAYQWDFGDGMGLSDQEHPNYGYTIPGVYPVRLTAFNSYFVCPRDTTILLHIIPDGILFIPNAFSPNDDGTNDHFYLKGEGLVSYDLQIFDRWGQLIAQSRDLSWGWDGRNSRGQMVQEGVYVFQVQARFNNGRTLERAGTITLIR